MRVHPGRTLGKYVLSAAERRALVRFLKTNGIIIDGQEHLVPNSGAEVDRMTAVFASAGDIVLSRDSVFLPRPADGRPADEPEHLMHFGRVLRCITIPTPGIDPAEGSDELLLVMADWLTSAEPARADLWRGKQIDTELQCPVVDKRPRRLQDGPWWFVNSIVPWPCWAVDHPSNSDKLAILARHWFVLRYLFPYPTKVPIR
jgi:hypothetical protein